VFIQWSRLSLCLALWTSIHVSFSVHWADWVGAFWHRRPAAVAKSFGLSVGGLVEYVAESPLKAVSVARLLCKLANYGRVCQYAATDKPGGNAPLQILCTEEEQDLRPAHKRVVLFPYALLDARLFQLGKSV